MKDILNNWPEGLKRTKQRERIISILKNGEEPLSAMDIALIMEKNGEKVWMSTIYRGLELFVKHEIVLKIDMVNSGVSLYELNRFEHKHYAICTNCHQTIPIDNCPMDKFVPHIQDKDFQIMGHNIEIFGYCKDCNITNNDKNN